MAAYHGDSFNIRIYLLLMTAFLQRNVASERICSEFPLRFWLEDFRNGLYVSHCTSLRGAMLQAFHFSTQLYMIQSVCNFAPPEYILRSTSPSNR